MWPVIYYPTICVEVLTHNKTPVPGVRHTKPTHPSKLHDLYGWKIIHLKVTSLPDINTGTRSLQIANFQEELVRKQGISRLHPLPFQYKLRKYFLIKTVLPIISKCIVTCITWTMLSPPHISFPPSNPDRKTPNHCSPSSLVSLYRLAYNKFV